MAPPCYGIMTHRSITLSRNRVEINVLLMERALFQSVQRNAGGRHRGSGEHPPPLLPLKGVSSIPTTDKVGEILLGSSFCKETITPGSLSKKNVGVFSSIPSRKRIRSLAPHTQWGGISFSFSGDIQGMILLGQDSAEKNEEEHALSP